VSLAVPVTLVVIPIETAAPALGDVIAEIGGVVSGTGIVIGVLGWETILHPELITIEPATASPIRTPMTLAKLSVNF
jgi:uncharacterized protein YqgV (UPF0045/DUF77 family)